MATKVRKINETTITFSENLSDFCILPIKMHKSGIFIQKSITKKIRGQITSIAHGLLIFETMRKPLYAMLTYSSLIIQSPMVRWVLS